MLLSLILAALSWVAVISAAAHHWLNLFIVIATIAITIWLLYVGLTMAVVADGSRVLRPQPWPRSCSRGDLLAIRLGTRLGTPTWRFVRQDGQEAFKVSPAMFSEATLRPLAEYLQVPLGADQPTS